MESNEYSLKIEYEDVYENILEVETNDYIKMNRKKNILLSYIIGVNKYSYDVGEHWHDWVEFIFVSEGMVDINFSNEQITLNRGDIIMIPSYALHSLNIYSSATLITLKISNAYLAGTYPWYDIANISCCSAKCISEEEYKKYCKLISDYRNIVNFFEYRNEHQKLGFDAYFQLFLYHLYSAFKVDEQVSYFGKASSISSVLSYIHIHYREQINQSEIAKYFFLTPQHLSKIFKKEMGITFKKYITTLRITQAAFELTNTNKSITSILYNCGFPNQQSFIKDFKKLYGCLPNEYRKKHLIST